MALRIGASLFVLREERVAWDLARREDMDG